MAYSHDSWVTLPESTATEIAAKLTKLRLHIQEVSQKITEDYSIDGRSKSVGNLNTYLAGLKADEAGLKAAAGEGNHTSLGVMRVGRAG